VSATEPITVRPAGQEKERFALPKAPVAKKAVFKINPEKIAALRADSERVAALLAPIFQNERSDSGATVEKQTAADFTPPPAFEPLIPGLEKDYSEFAKLLFSRTEWSRTELEELAKDRGLPLDGAMERVNDAFYDKFNQALLIETGSNIGINQEVLKEVI